MLPIYDNNNDHDNGNDNRDKPLLILVKEFNMMVKDGDLFKDNEFGMVLTQDTFTNQKLMNRLKTTKEMCCKLSTLSEGQGKRELVEVGQGPTGISGHHYKCGQHAWS